MHQSVCNRHSGYTLVEMAIVLSIMGVLAGGILSLGSVKHEAAKMALTQQRLDKIEKAINLHALAAGFLPCPADPIALPGSAEYGVAADCSAAAPAGIDSTGTGANEVWIGAIPNRTLNLPDTTMYDAWLNRFTYAVVRDLAWDADTFSNYSTSGTTGIIQIVDDDGTQVTDAQTDTVVAYALVSHGKDKKGAINRAGTMPVVCGATTKDDENCDGDVVFRDSRIADSTLPANYYNDLIRWKARNFLQPLATSTASCPTDPTNGLIAHWKLDESAGTTAADSSGNGNVGALTNMDPATDWLPSGGQVNGALDFDGVDDRVNAGHPAALDLNSDFTISAWVKVRAFGFLQRGIVTRSNGGAGSFIGIRADDGGCSPTDGMGLTFRINDGTNNVESCMDSAVTDTWYLVTMVIGSRGLDGLKGYVDGVEEVSLDTSAIGALSFGVKDWFIGYNQRNNKYLDGLIDDVRIYNRALSAQEVKDLYDSANCP